MPRTVHIAAVQMDANPAPTPERLARADRLVTDAARAGVDLVALPELFNLGYIYDESNHRRAEAPDGPTVAWMRETAARWGIHLAGSLLLRDGSEVYNALLVLAPDGRQWRYDKRYPWGWERSAFRPGRGVTVAETDLGHLGLLICWDAAHPGLWRQYAGRVDLMVIASCPPDISQAVYRFPDGRQLPPADMGPVLRTLLQAAHRVFGDVIRQQATWMGVPAVNTVGCGHITTPIPNGRLSMLSMAPLAPALLKYLSQADRVQMSCDMAPGCQVIDAQGRVLAALAQADGETFTSAAVTLPAERPAPRGPQPETGLSRLAYLASDILLPLVSLPAYRRGLRQR